MRTALGDEEDLDEGEVAVALLAAQAPDAGLLVGVNVGKVFEGCSSVQDAIKDKQKAEEDGQEASEQEFKAPHEVRHKCGTDGCQLESQHSGLCDVALRFPSRRCQGRHETALGSQRQPVGLLACSVAAALKAAQEPIAEPRAAQSCQACLGKHRAHTCRPIPAPTQAIQRHGLPRQREVSKVAQTSVVASLRLSAAPTSSDTFEPVIDLSQWQSDTTSSGYVNVYRKKNNGKFEAFSKSCKRSKQYLGAYDTAEEAAAVVARFTLLNPISAVEPVDPVVATPAERELVVDLSQWRSDTCSSGFKGVELNNGEGKFEQRQVAAVSQAAKDPLVDPHADNDNEPQDATKVEPMLQLPNANQASDTTQSKLYVAAASNDVVEPAIDLSEWRSEKYSSGYKGVRWHRNRDKYEAWMGKARYLGAYNTVEEAAMVVARTQISEDRPVLTQEKTDEPCSNDDHLMLI